MVVVGGCGVLDDGLFYLGKVVLKYVIIGCGDGLFINVVSWLCLLEEDIEKYGFVVDD